MMPPNIIDIEASGFGKGSYPIEVGYMSRYGKSWCSLIIPDEDWSHWDQSAESLHQISRSTLFQHGKAIVAVADHLNQVFPNQTVYTDGWLQDYTWISSLFELAEITPRFKLDDLRKVLTPYQESIWHETKQAIVHEMQTSRHRASADARVLQMTWLKTAGMEAQADVSQSSRHSIY